VQEEEEATYCKKIKKEDGHTWPMTGQSLLSLSTLF
jgi:methionyl-tRNA formyltransferase